MCFLPGGSPFTGDRRRAKSIRTIASPPHPLRSLSLKHSILILRVPTLVRQSLTGARPNYQYLPFWHPGYPRRQCITPNPHAHSSPTNATVHHQSLLPPRERERRREVEGGTGRWRAGGGRRRKVLHLGGSTLGTRQRQQSGSGARPSTYTHCCCRRVT